jgi:hypothetical protein
MAVLLIGPLVAFAKAQTVNNQVPEIHLVLFVAAGLQPPGDAEEKIAAAAEYTETFFVKWMKHWGYPPAQERIFPRGSNGRIQVLQIRGSKPAEQYTKALELMQELWPKALATYGMPRNNPLWWVFVYKGDPPTRFDEYRGSGDLRRGGWAVVNYENRPGQISVDKEMAEGFHHDFTLKGCVHELGHALGLFHVGPIGADRLGNTVMGPRTDPFRATVRNQAYHDRVYLCQAEAAMLWKHFVFSGTTKDRSVLPSVEVRGYRARREQSRGEIVIAGTLVSDGKAHSVVLVDESPPKQQDYWAKAYVARIDQEGRFEVRVREPSGAAGTFRLMFCFENGAITGDGKTREPSGAFAKRYVVLNGGYRFEP